MKARFVLPLFVSVVAMAQPAGTFTLTGSMSTARWGHTATLLPNGKVLIAGGTTLCFLNAQPCVGPNTAELYDPATGSFAPTGNMSPSPQHIGGVLLPDGRVLFAGSNFTGTPAIVELYDPATGSFSIAGSAATLTYVQSATLLNDGRVLLTGDSSPPFSNGAELYDPAAGTFSAVANWPAEGPWPVAVLTDGRVFLVYYEDKAGLYDPATGTFSRTNGLIGFDDPPAATQLFSYDVLFTGGNPPAGIELYDPSSDAFANGIMPIPRDGHTATLLPDGTVLLAGGETNSSIQYPSTPTGDIYDPATGKFTATGNMNTARADHTATLLKNGQVLITGGSGFGSIVSIAGISSAELYTPAVLVPAPVLFSLSGDGQGQGAIWHATTGAIASPDSPAVAGEALSMYTTSLAAGGVIPPQVTVGGRVAEVLYFGPAPGYPGFNQVNFRVPSGVAPGPTVPVRLDYLGRPTNEITIAIQ